MSEKKKTVKPEEPAKAAVDGPRNGNWFSVGPDGRRKNFSKEREFPGTKKP